MKKFIYRLYFFSLFSGFFFISAFSQVKEPSPNNNKGEWEVALQSGWSEMSVVAGGQVIYRFPISRELKLGIGAQSLITGDGRGHHGILGEISTRFGRQKRFSIGLQLGHSIGYTKTSADVFSTNPAYEYYYDKERFLQVNLMYHFKSKGRVQYSLGGFFLTQNSRLNHYPKGNDPVILNHGIRTSVVSAGIRFAVSF